MQVDCDKKCDELWKEDEFSVEESSLLGCDTASYRNSLRMPGHLTSLIARRI
jgi:hypothetical protein